LAAPSFDLDVVREGSSARIAPAGELDIATAPRLEQAIAEVIGDDGADLVLDLRALTFMDSTGLRTLVQTHQRAQSEGFNLAIWRGPHQIDRLLAVSGLEDVLPLSDAPAD
jgi:anti-sigma B factor antagonist